MLFFSEKPLIESHLFEILTLKKGAHFDCMLSEILFLWRQCIARCVIFYLWGNTEREKKVL